MRRRVQPQCGPLHIWTIIGAGVYVFRSREKLFGYLGSEGDTYASANLRLAMVVIIWVHSVILTAIMIFEV
jgi:hypothetical protein